MTTLVQIGNSQGVRIPKGIIKQAKLENVKLEFEILKKGLLIKPIIDKPRSGWSENIAKVLKQNESKEDEGYLVDFLDDSDLEDFEW